MARKTHDIVATVGEYTQGGVTKKRFLTCGSAFTTDDGRISLKLDAVPLAREWSGWLSLYPAGDRARTGGDPRPQSAPSPDAARPDMAEDDIPF